MRAKSRNEYIGISKITNEGYTVKCIGVSNKANRIIVQFEDEVVLEVSISSFKNGTIKNRNHKSVCGVGFLGYGKYKTGTSRNRPKIEKDCYWFWTSMIKRVHNPNKNTRSMSYQRKQVTIYEDWYNFQNFADWFYNKSNYRLGWVLDKDLLSDKNIYSPETCLFIPERVNNFIATHYNTNTSGKTGVIIRGGKYVARTWFYDPILNKQIAYHLGEYDNINDAYVSYLKKRIELSDILSDMMIKEFNLNKDDIIIKSLKNLYRRELNSFIKNEPSY